MRRNLLNKKCVYQFGIFIAGFLPLIILRGIAKFIALLNYLFFKEARKNVQKNLSHIYKDSRKVKSTTKRIFLNYGRYVADWAKLNHIDSKEVLNFFTFVKGKEITEEALKKGKGILLLTAHLGNWELGGLYFSHIGIPINAITAKDQIDEVARIREGTRTLHNVKTITIESNTFFFVEVVNVLRKNEMVAMLMDRYSGGNGIQVDFFGSPILFPTGPILIARSTGASVIPAFVVFDSDGKYKAIADSIVNIERTDDVEKDIKVNLTKIIRILEKYILEYSDQWYNFVDLWKVPSSNLGKE